jgi:hypothetical protein
MRCCSLHEVFARPQPRGRFRPDTSYVMTAIR